ncbi:hypothetical protein HY212_03320 [Candidatus Pacearchaeota archaeon]|nr:hypothetical protein [Candidatus Pacearchaeota archaeon]
MGIIKSETDIVIENKAIKSMILSMRIKLAEEVIEIFNRNPNRKPEKDVKIALSLNTAP